MAQKKVKSRKGSQFRSPAPPRTHEKQLRELLRCMFEEMRERFRNNVLEEYNQSNIEKFHTTEVDAAPRFIDGNFARDWTRLANKVKQMIQQQFPNKRLRQEVQKIMFRANRDNRDRLYNSLERRVGVDRTELVKREGLQWQANARIEQVYEWVEKMRDETLEGFHRNTLQKMIEGRSIDEVIDEFENTASKRENHVQYLAQTQIANFNSQMTRLRAQRLGIQKAKWITAEDERVRGRPGGKYPNAKPSHWWAHNREFNLEEGLKFPNGEVLWPGSSHRCRCTMLLIVPGEEEEEQQEEAEA